MSRSTWKGPFTDRIQKPNIIKVRPGVRGGLGAHATPLQRSTKRGIGGKMQPFGQPLLIWSRRSQILPTDIGKEFLVHNGRAFISVKCTEFMCSRKWGEFAVTRKKPLHKLNKRKQLHKRVA